MGGVNRSSFCTPDFLYLRNFPICPWIIPLNSARSFQTTHGLPFHHTSLSAPRTRLDSNIVLLFGEIESPDLLVLRYFYTYLKLNTIADRYQLFYVYNFETSVTRDNVFIIFQEIAFNCNNYLFSYLIVCLSISLTCTILFTELN